MEPPATMELRGRKAADVRGETKKKCEMNELSRGRIQSATRRSSDPRRIDGERACRRAHGLDV